MITSSPPNHPKSNQDRLRLRQLRLQLLSGFLILAGGVGAYLEVGVLICGTLLLAGLAVLFLTPRV